MFKSSCANVHDEFAAAGDRKGGRVGGKGEEKRGKKKKEVNGKKYSCKVRDFRG